MTGAFAGLKDDAGAEAEKAAAGVREALDAASREMREGLEEAQSRFGESVTNLREMASSIRSELETTRADLARGVLELPRETQDAAGEMRRVVADQIKALNELSALVARTGRTVDVAQPVAQTQRRVAEGGSRSLAAPASPRCRPRPRRLPRPPRRAPPRCRRPRPPRRPPRPRARSETRPGHAASGQPGPRHGGGQQQEGLALRPPHPRLAG